MKVIPKFQNSRKFTTKEYNKRKQLFLNLNGIKVKVDGSLGPWQELLYKRLTTKDKHYKTTPLGFLSYLYDKTLGDGTTYQEDPAIVKGYSVEIKLDNRSATRRYLDQQMLDNKTPLGYITQTVLPSAAVAGTLVYGGPAIVNGIRTAISNPSIILPAAKTLAKEGIKGMAGATAVNAASKVTTGKTWGELVALSTGVSSDLGEFTNPGFVLGSAAYNIGKNLYNKGPKYVFDNLPYKTIYNIDRVTSNIKNDVITFLKTPINESPIKAIRNRRKSLLVGKTPRTDILYDNNVYYNINKSSIQNIYDPIYLIRKRLRNRMNNNDYKYSFPYDGIDIHSKANITPDYIISLIPVKDYLSFKEVYKLITEGENNLSNKILGVISTPYMYLKVNTTPAFASTGVIPRFIKVNKKALKDLGFDYATVLSHEYNHALRNRSFGDGEFLRNLGFNYSHLDPAYRDYLSSPTEIEARGTLLKNYFDSDIITPDMLKYASLHYVKDTNIDNNMYLFFSGIKDWNLAADYLSKFSLKNGGKLIPKCLYGNPLLLTLSMNNSELNRLHFKKSTPSFKGIKTTNNRPYNPEYISYAYNRIKHLPKELIAVALGTWIEESGGDPFSVSKDGLFLGINQWGRDRYSVNRIKNPSKELIYKELDKQIDYYLSSINNMTDLKSWTDGGKGSLYSSKLSAYNLYNGRIPFTNNIANIFRAHSFGYTRPTGKEKAYRNRLKVVLQVYDKIK